MQGERDNQQHNNQDWNKVNQHQQQEPQKCPRCDSLNTKFCYYNNYSLSQPRYFCKACRRFWTHGGTLRNVPVGGGSRRGKRAKTMPSSSSATTSSRSEIQPPQLPQDHQLHERYLTSMPFTQNLGHLGGSNQLGSGGGGSSNLGLLHGLNAISSYGQRQMQSQLFDNIEPSPHPSLLFQPAMTSGYMTYWPKSFINKSHASPSAPAASSGHSALWSTATGNNTSVTAGPSLNSTQLPDDHAASFDADHPQ